MRILCHFNRQSPKTPMNGSLLARSDLGNRSSTFQKIDIIRLKEVGTRGGPAYTCRSGGVGESGRSVGAWPSSESGLAQLAVRIGNMSLLNGLHRLRSFVRQHSYTLIFWGVIM